MNIRNITMSITAVLAMAGCGAGETNTGVLSVNEPMTLSGNYKAMCDRQPYSVMCGMNPRVEVNPFDVEYLENVKAELYGNFTYADDIKEDGTATDYWAHNDYTSEALTGDCEDISMTLISQLVLDGYPPQSIKLVISGDGVVARHAYVRVTLEDGSPWEFYTVEKVDGVVLQDMHYMQLDNATGFTKLPVFNSKLD